MYKKEVTYVDLNGNACSEVLYFNLTKRELIKMQAEGLGEALQAMLQDQDLTKMLVKIEDLMVAAYGVKSEDGKSFEKSDELRKKFQGSLAFDAMYEEILLVDNAALTFFQAIIPTDLIASMELQNEAAKNLLPPPTS